MAILGWDRNFALEQAGDDEAILSELLLLFRDSSVADIARIQEGLERQDAIAVADAAHSIKGAAASLGVDEIRAVAADLEKLGRSGDLSALAAPASRLAELVAVLGDLK